jgi:hypothetical protein
MLARLMILGAIVIKRTDNPNSFSKSYDLGVTWNTWTPSLYHCPSYFATNTNSFHPNGTLISQTVSGLFAINPNNASQVRIG